MSAIDVYLSRPWTKFQSAKPGAFEVPLQSVTQAFDAATERDPGRTAVVFYGRSITYRELREATDRLANALASLGLKKGDRIALYLVNSPQFIIAYFAALKCGATVTPISPVYTSHEIRYQIEDSGARAIVCQDILYEKVAKCGAQLDLVVVTNVNEYLPALKRLFGKKAEVPGQVHWLQDLLKKYPAKPPVVNLDPQRDLAAAGAHRIGQGPRLARHKDDHRLLRRLLQRLEKGVGRLGVERVCRVDDYDARPRFERRQVEQSLRPPHLADAHVA